MNEEIDASPTAAARPMCPWQRGDAVVHRQLLDQADGESQGGANAPIGVRQREFESDAGLTDVLAVANA